LIIKSFVKQICPPILYLGAHKVKVAVIRRGAEKRKAREDRRELKAFLSDPRLKNTRYDMVAGRKAMTEAKGKINTVISLLADGRSKDVYTKELLSRRRMKNMMPPEHVEPVNQQYFDRNIIRIADNEIFIDAGAYDGATTALFLQNANSPDVKSYLFEPDSTMFQAMCEKIAPLNDGNMEFIKAGLSSESGTAKFMKRPIGSSRIDPSGDEEITTIALDNYIDEATFIKMDIEGGEMNALKGARRIITECKPKLAISIYHNINDLWEVPLLIHSINPDYKLYVRKYEGAAGYFLNEVVCYAVLESH
jgi:FkbM family methyltransferase